MTQENKKSSPDATTRSLDSERPEWPEVEVWTIYSTHPAEKQHPPKDDCENCDGRGCMSCVMRKVHDKCADDCPICCADNFESTPVEVVRASDYEKAASIAQAERERAKKAKVWRKRYYAEVDEVARLRGALGEVEDFGDLAAVRVARAALSPHTQPSDAEGCKECGGRGTIQTGECEVAMSGPTCMNPDCPPCQTPETEPCPDCTKEGS